MQDLSDRIVELEIRFTHQAQLVDELNQELAHANRRITLLEKENRAFREMFKSMSPEMIESPDE